MATAVELTTTVGKLEERITNYLRFAVVVTVCLAGWLGWLTNLVINTKNSVASVQKSQSEIAGRLAKDDLLEHAALPLEEFKATLPDLKSAVAMARQHHVVVPPKVVEDLKQKLLTTDKSAPGFWPATSALITYQSQAAENWSIWNLPSCITQMHKRKLLQDVSPGTQTVALGPVEVSDCQIVLDSPEADQHLSFDLSMGSVIFHHCVIFYNGGAITIVPVKVATQSPAKINGDLQFDNCLFVFSLPDNPSQQGQKFAETLLAAQKPTTVKFNPVT